MSSALYLLLLRSDPSHRDSAPREALRNHLSRIPNLIHQGDDLYHFGERDEHGIMQLEFLVFRDGRRIPAEQWSDLEQDRCNGVEVRIPRAWVMEKGPQVFALVFMIAEWYGWQVFDPQIGDTLQKEAVLQGLVAARQARLHAEGRGGSPGIQAHFVRGETAQGTQDAQVSFDRPARPEGVKMPSRSQQNETIEPYVPRTRPGAEEVPPPKKPWWKRFGG